MTADKLRAAADAATFHARSAQVEGDRIRERDARSAAVWYREAGACYRYAAAMLTRAGDPVNADAHRIEAARADGLAAGLAG